jgi:hypothetical protein
MRSSIILALGVFAAAVSFAADEQVFLANISGTIYASTGEVIVQGQFKNDRIFTDFGVSEAEYALVLQPNSNEFLVLRPKSASSPSNTIPILEINEARALTSSKTKSAMYEAPFTNKTDRINLFTTMRGNVFGTAKYSDVEQGIFSKLTFNGDGSSGGDFSALLVRFKVTSGKRFVATP